MKKLWILSATLLAVLSACSVLQAIRLKDCTYEYTKVDNVKLLELTKSEAISIRGVAKITKALLGKTETIPLNFTVHVKATNPNKQMAAMERLFYSVSLDSIHVADGNTETSLILPAETSTDLPLYISVDLKQLLSSQAKPTIKKVIRQLAGLEDDSTQVTVQLKPVIRIADNLVSLKKPIYIQFMYGGKTQEKTK